MQSNTAESTKKQTQKFKLSKNIEYAIMSSNINKSSSFYGEAYYQRARKLGKTKKVVYRQKNKQLYDQQHELQILRDYKNDQGICQMIRYWELIAGAYFNLKDKKVKGSDQYNQAVKEFTQDVRERMKKFHQQLLTQDFITRQEMSKNMQMERSNSQQTKEKFDSIVKKTSLDQCETSLMKQRRLLTCNHCQIFIEQYQHNYHKTISSMAKQATNWDKLNGNQKLAKFSKLIEQNLKILKHEFEHKCQYAKTRQALCPLKISDLTCLFQ